MEEELPITTQIRNRVEECFVIAEKHFGQKFPRCRVEFSLTGTTSGTANYGKKLIRFNTKLLVDNPEYFLRQTCPHEVVHILQYHLYWGKVVPLRPHGKEFQSLMRNVFNLKPNRCHSLNTDKVTRKTKPYSYSCNCHGKIHLCGLIKHKRIQKSHRDSGVGGQYICKKCLTPMVFLNKVTAPIETAKRGMMTPEQLD